MPRASRSRATARCTRPCAGATRRWTSSQAQSHERFGGLTGLRFNIGRIEGGIKANMIAPTAEVRFGFRPLPTMDADAPARARSAAWSSRSRPSSPRPSAAIRCRPATPPRRKPAAWPRATWPTSWTFRSATRSTSGPRRRCSPPAATPPSSTARATSPRRTPPTSGSRSSQLQHYAETIHRIVDEQRMSRSAPITTTP